MEVVQVSDDVVVTTWNLVLCIFVK